MLEEQDTLGTARALARLGGVAYERFIDLAAAGESSDRLAGILNDVVQLGIRALDLTPEEASADLARIYRQLGAAFREADDIERSLINYQRALQHEERQADPYGAGQTRYGAALTLSRAGRLADALLYARAALRDYERTGPGANTDAERARELIARLERGETEPERPPQRPNVGYYVVQADWRGRHQER
jgi:tetratricopeptide (TPR) repeat protein